MTNEKRTEIIDLVTKREALRDIGRFERLIREPLRTAPYYLLAAAARVRPFKKSFSTLWDTRMSCYLPEGNTFYFYGYCEANLTNFFLRFTQEGMICIDVGAHVGIYSMLFSEIVGDTGSVHSFEPTPWTFALLKDNTSLLKNVTINNNAIAESARTLTFSDYGPGYGAYNSAHANSAPALSATPTVTEVQSISLDDYCQKHNLTPDIIKIDSEGFEHEVLQGMSSLLQQNKKKRPLVSIEVANEEAWKQNRLASFALLEHAGYLPYTITTSGHITPHTGHESYEYDNVLFVPVEAAERMKTFHLKENSNEQNDKK